MKKVYEVFVTDIWNNCYFIGFFENLDDAIQDINCYIFDEKYHILPGEIGEYPSTFGPCIDATVGDILQGRGMDLTEAYDEGDEDLSLMIRGFVLEYENSLDDFIVKAKE